MSISDLSQNDFKIFKKIILRGLKELGVYNSVTSKGFKDAGGINDFFLYKKKGLDILNYAIDVLWQPVHYSTNSPFKASLFVCLVLTDSRFYDLLSNNDGEIGLETQVADVISIELEYLREKDYHLWKSKATKDDVVKLKELIPKIENFKSPRLNGTVLQLKTLLKNYGL